MQDKLLGYLLGALEAEEIAVVEKTIASQRELHGQLDQLRLVLAPLEPLRQEVDAPSGLAVRTCQRIREIRLAGP
jgi:anti-sigma-K factor RskA